MPVVRIRNLIGTTVVRIRIPIGTTVVWIRILIGTTVVRIASVIEDILYFITVTQKEYSEPSNWLFEEKKNGKVTCLPNVIMGGTLLSIDNFLFTLFYAVILHITLNFKFFSLCIAGQMTRRACPECLLKTSRRALSRIFFSKT